MSRIEGLSVEEVARNFGVHKTTIERRIRRYRETKGKEGLGPIFRDGKIVRVPESSITEWMARNTGY
jgi:transposase